MDFEKLKPMLDRGKVLFPSLLTEASLLLQNLDVWGNEGFELAIAKRSELIEEIQVIDKCCVNYLESMAGKELDKGASVALAEFRNLQETTTRKVLELDAMVIALAEGCLDSLKAEMAALSRGKTAFAGYEKSGRSRERNMDDFA